MKRTRAGRRLTATYVLACAVLVGAMAYVTRMAVDAVRAQELARWQSDFHEDLRDAMWRMEARVGTMIATTTNRVPQPSAWIDPASNTVNPLDGSSEAYGLETEIVEAADQAFVLACELMDEPPEPLPVPTVAETTNIPRQQTFDRGALRSQNEFQRRYLSNSSQQISMVNSEPQGGFTTCVGPLAPVWGGEQRDATGGLELYLARRVEAPEGVRHETYRLDWEALRRTLLAEVTDLFPDAGLEPIVEPDEVRPYDPTRTALTEANATRLAAIPARLVVAEPQVVRGPFPAILAVGLGGAWAALLLALALGGFALRASVAYGDKHRRFTQAVTHELRTPLTTFRMYSEMLARGIVSEEARPEYLATLESESTRLAGLVENVLRYARIEEGGSTPARESLTLSDLVQRSAPELARVCDQAGCALEIRDADDGEDAAVVRVSTDGGAVHQIALNLVENACKYGRVDDDRPARVVLATSCDEKHVYVDVVDSGPGIEPSRRRAIFQPFERAGRDSSDPAPGVGLGLALSRELAGELGGSLELLPTTSGAAFRLTLPRSTTA
ncbi:MAG: HAMP domain-containing sensor histidine kinase [Planctomycetota bacterium]